MIDFELTDEQRLVRDTARDFADNEIVPRARENDRNHHFDTELVKKLADGLEDGEDAIGHCVEVVDEVPLGRVGVVEQGLVEVGERDPVALLGLAGLGHA